MQGKWSFLALKSGVENGWTRAILGSRIGMGRGVPQLKYKNQITNFMFTLFLIDCKDVIKI